MYTLANIYKISVLARNRTAKMFWQSAAKRYWWHCCGSGGGDVVSRRRSIGTETQAGAGLMCVSQVQMMRFLLLFPLLWKYGFLPGLLPVGGTWCEAVTALLLVQFAISHTSSLPACRQHFQPAHKYKHVLDILFQDSRLYQSHVNCWDTW